jgi:GNAT superfamily N-acetyltransferase
MPSPSAAVTISLEPEPADLVRGAVLDGLHAFNALHVPAPEFQGLVVSARSGRKIVGGLAGETGWQWLHVSRLWVAEPYRHQGIGTQLLKAAEAEALRRDLALSSTATG